MAFQSRAREREGGSLSHPWRHARWKQAGAGLRSGYRESHASWAAVLRQLKRRGLQTARLLVGDGHLGLWAAVGDVFPEAKEQLCWNHKSLNVLDALPKREQAVVKPHLPAMMYAESRSKACEARKQFEHACRHQPKAIKTIVDHWGQLTSYDDFPREHGKHLRTSNVVESPFSRVQLRTSAARRLKSATNATWLIWKALMVAEKNFRKLNAPHLVEDVAEGRIYSNGIEGDKRGAA